MIDGFAFAAAWKKWRRAARAASSVLCLQLLTHVALAATTYATNFDLTESKISEGNAWLTGLDPLQMPVSTANGIAFGTQTGAEYASQNYNDSQAWLAGTFPSDQMASVVIHKTAGLSGGYQEVEILLRWSIGPRRTGLPYGDTYSYGYEVNLAWDGQYIQIGRFKDQAMFDSLVSGSPLSTLKVQDGDIFSAEIAGNTITAKLTRNGVTTVLGSGTDNSPAPFANGSPGIGFYRGTAPGSTTNNLAFASTSFSGTGRSTNGASAPALDGTYSVGLAALILLVVGCHELWRRRPPARRAPSV
jgi:hypothetical protein